MRGGAICFRIQISPDETTMPPTKNSALRQWWELSLQAAGFLTCLPLPAPKHRQLGKAAAAFSLVGLAVGLLAALVYQVTVGSFGNLGAALLAVGAMVAVTGALHEDGLKDAADGLLGGDTPQERLKIMKDPTSGSFGVLALVLSLSGRIFFVAWLPPGDAVRALIVAAILSRAAMVAPAFFLEPVGNGELGKSLRPSNETLATGSVLGAVLALLFAGPVGGLGAIMATIAAAGAMVTLAKKKIGGFNGDICGATQQLAEWMVLVALVLAVPKV